MLFSRKDFLKAIGSLSVIPIVGLGHQDKSNAVEIEQEVIPQEIISTNIEDTDLYKWIKADFDKYDMNSPMIDINFLRYLYSKFKDSTSFSLIDVDYNIDRIVEFAKCIKNIYKNTNIDYKISFYMHQTNDNPTLYIFTPSLECIIYMKSKDEKKIKNIKWRNRFKGAASLDHKIYMHYGITCIPIGFQRDGKGYVDNYQSCITHVKEIEI